MSAMKVRSPFLTLLYNHNPFYAISTLLMLFAVRNAYGELNIGTINCWIMMGVLAVYTALLAVIGVLIVRLGKVWEDARSIALLLLMLFLAVSISADDLFASMESTAGGGLLLLCGYIFSAVVLETFLFAARIRLGSLYRIPLHLLLALFYVAPWWCSPELHPRSETALEWTIFLFPVVAAVLILAFIPAVRRGPEYVANNGTPWRWPLFPWTAVGVVVVAVAMRTFVLCMTFGPSGPIWIPLPSGGQAISFDTMWGPYFLIPPAFAVLVLVMEAGLVTGNQRLVRRVMFATPMLLLLSIPLSSGAVFTEFLQDFTATVGSPIWLAVWLQMAFYGWAWCRRVAGAEFGGVATMCLLSIVGPTTLRLDTLIEPRALPLFIVGGLLLVNGLRVRSSKVVTASCALLTFAVWMVLPETTLSNYRMSACYHLLWASVVVIGLVFRDRFAGVLRFIGAAQVPLATVVVLGSSQTADLPLSWRLSYVFALGGICLMIANIWRSRWYLYAFTSQLAIAGYGATVLGFRGAVNVMGRAATTSFLWSLGALLLAFLISAHKARWLPSPLFPRWGNGGGRTQPAMAVDAPIEETEPPPDSPG